MRLTGVRCRERRATESIATAAEGLVFPSDVLFGPEETAGSLFVCNFANQSPEDGAILRVRL